MLLVSSNQLQNERLQLRLYRVYVTGSEDRGQTTFKSIYILGIHLGLKSFNPVPRVSKDYTQISLSGVFIFHLYPR